MLAKFYKGIILGSMGLNIMFLVTICFSICIIVEVYNPCPIAFSFISFKFLPFTFIAIYYSMNFYFFATYLYKFIVHIQFWIFNSLYFAFLPFNLLILQIKAFIVTLHTIYRNSSSRLWSRIKRSQSQRLDQELIRSLGLIGLDRASNKAHPD